MINSKYEWKEIDSPSVDDLTSLVSKTQLSPIIIKLLAQKGFTSQTEIEDFLKPTGKNIHDPFLLHDMDKAVERIQDAIMNGERIVIYGDYDADGITSTAVMYETLEQLGANVSYFVPDRFEDGYGPNLNEYKKLAATGMQLLITVDNGVTGVNEVQYLANQGIDTVITDHHELPEKLPDAFAIVHPDYPGSQYPFKHLAGVGVAFKVACALLEEIPEELLDLVAIGTVADIVSLTNENRDLVSFGIKALQSTGRLGLLALFDVAKIDQTQLNADTIGFMLAPRLNALGRMENAKQGVQLLTTLDDQEAKQLAAHTQQLNEKRQDLVAKITIEASNKLDDKHLVNVIVGEDWHEGVLGIVASRIAEQTHKPTIVLTQTSTGIYKGSGRSVGNFNLFNAFDSHRKIFENFGGHAKACGISIKADNLGVLQVIADQEAENQHFDPSQKEELTIAEQIKLSDVNVALINEIEQLAPFGEDNPRPVFAIQFANPQLSLMGNQQQHFRLDKIVNGQKISAIKFNALKEEIQTLQTSSLQGLWIAGELAVNQWKGKVFPQIKIKDLRTSSKAEKFVIQRSSQLTQEMFAADEIYGFFDSRVEKQVSESVNHHIRHINLNAQQEITAKKLVIVDCPNSLDSFKKVMQHLHVNQIVLKCYSRHDFSQVPMPSHADFVKLYRFTSTHHDLNLRNEIKHIAEYLNFDQSILIFMLQVFFEVGFVKIENGLLTGTPSQKHVDLTKANRYQAQVKLIEAQKKFIHSSDEDLINWLNEL